MQLEFSKYHGLGNDFILIEEQRYRQALTRSQVEAWCDRHRGIGADGVIIVAIDREGPRMIIFNADGSRPEMCGNGLRCAAFYLLKRGLMSRQTFVVDTDAGPHRCIVTSDADNRAFVEVAMRSPEWLVVDGESWLDTTVKIENASLRVSALSLGNPHLVVIEDQLSAFDRQRIAPLLECDPRFPQGINVGFMRVQEDQSLQLKVWERGVGWTAACGTGACAAAAVAVKLNLTKADERTTVHLPGGDLQVHVTLPDFALSMRGPTVHVFDGSLEVD